MNYWFHIEELYFLLHKDSNGKVKHHRVQRKVVTHGDSYNLPYYSTKDVSGVFFIENGACSSSKKTFIKLYLQKEINFVDSISYNDYLNQKDLF